MNVLERITKSLLTASVALALVLLPQVAAAAAPATSPKKTTVEVAVPKATPAAAPSYAPASEIGSFSLGGTLGLGLGSDWTTFRIEARPQYTLRQLAPNFYLDLAGHVGLDVGSHGSKVFELVPAARFRYLLNDKISFYGDGGAGVAFYSFSETIGNIQLSGSQTWGVIRFAGGVQYKVTPTISLVGEPVGMNIYFGTGSGFVYSLAAGALFKL